MISIRYVQESDASFIKKWKTDLFVKEMALDLNYNTTLEEQIMDIRNSINDDEQEYKIILNNGNPIGYIRINWMDDKKEKAWLRFALGEERGNGYAFIALKQYCMELKIKGCLRVEAEVYKTNIASKKVLEKIGFEMEGIKRKAHYTGNEYIDVYVYGLLMNEAKFNINHPTIASI